MSPEKRSRVEYLPPGDERINTVIEPLLTDLYQITMAYAYWKSGKHNTIATFDLFFRKNPFRGEFTVFAGLLDCIDFLKRFNIKDSDIEYLKTLMPHCEDAFFSFLKVLKPSEIVIESLSEGSVCFPRIPLMTVTGPLIMVQLLETIFLNLINYASLVATNAARFRIAAGRRMKLYEFGLRRAQGPNGGLSASKYSYMGGFDGTSNVLAGKLFGIPVKGTHAHAFVSSYLNMKEIEGKILLPKPGFKPEGDQDFLSLVSHRHTQVAELLKLMGTESSEGERAAFASYALAFPHEFLALIDTYDVCKSGILNFCAVALALNDLGYRAVGVRIDSGDLAYLSTLVKKVFEKIAARLVTKLIVPP